MNTKYIENIIFLCKCLHHSTNLVTIAFNDNKVIYQSNSNILTAQKILYDKYQNIDILDKKEKYQIIKNKYKENYFIISFFEVKIYIIIGPFLSEEINIGIITNMIRNGLVPFHKKTQIQEYYKNVQFFNEDKIFYISKLIENIFDNTEKSLKIQENKSLSTDKQTDEYYSKIKQNRINSFSHSTYFNELKISETIKNGDKEKAKIILNEINLTPHAKLAVDEIRSYKNSMICSCTFMTRAAINGGVSPNEAFTLSDTYINKIEDIQNIKELENFEATMVEGFTDLVNSAKVNKYSRSILNAINYIDKHLCEEIKIKDIAKESYLNPSYLSNLFHKETNKTITEWILLKRIKEAAFSVANTNEDIAEIAFFYHFCSESYFVKCFKKVIGVTPGEYRNSQKKKEAI